MKSKTTQKINRKEKSKILKLCHRLENKKPTQSIEKRLSNFSIQDEEMEDESESSSCEYDEEVNFRPGPIALRTRRARGRFSTSFTDSIMGYNKGETSNSDQEMERLDEKADCFDDKKDILSESKNSEKGETVPLVKSNAIHNQVQSQNCQKLEKNGEFSNNSKEKENQNYVDDVKSKRFKE